MTKPSRLSGDQFDNLLYVFRRGDKEQIILLVDDLLASRDAEFVFSLVRLIIHQSANERAAGPFAPSHVILMRKKGLFKHPCPLHPQYCHFFFQTLAV
jgi:hypothetical protein